MEEHYVRGVTSLTFDHLEIGPWRQFERLDIDLSSQLTILTGANGAGKTTLLSLLGYHFNWTSPFVGSQRRRRSRGREYTYEEEGRLKSVSYEGASETIGGLHYSDGSWTPLSVPTTSAPQFSVAFDRQQAVEGLFITSHRASSGYKAVTSIPSRFSGASELFQQFTKEIRDPVMGKSSRKNPRLVMKESLLAAALYGEQTSSVRSDNEAREVWIGFQDHLRELLPDSLGFRRLVAEPPEIIVETRHGEFALDALSGGLTSIFELSWQIFLESRDHDIFTVCFDEPENHLHPALQRSIMPSLMRSFPRVNFVVATHSPFVVTSSQEASVIALSRDDAGRVRADSLKFSEYGVSAEATLEEVLGVSTTLPIWAEEAFAAVLNRHAGSMPTADVLRSIRDELAELGLSNEIPRALSAIVDGYTE